MIKRLLSIASCILVLSLITSAIYAMDFYRADESGIATHSETVNVEYKQSGTNILVFEAENSDTGIVFYPGGKIDYNAYIPICSELADRGISVVLIKMPFNLAIFGKNSADGVYDLCPDVTDWYIAGHSLGGSMAGEYAAKNPDKVEGLILLGAYTISDISDTDLDVLSIYGSEDKIMNMNKYEKNFSNLPDDTTEIVIEGGCHSYFGMYGMQDSDGTPAITVEEQLTQTADAIFDFVFASGN